MMLSNQKIDGRTKLVGLIGWPVAHSLSPLIHNHAFSGLGLNYAYVPLPVRPENLDSAIKAIRTFGFAGANVTIPHKIEIAKLCDCLSTESILTGAVNTLYFENDMLHGTTTDADGFLNALKHMKHDPKNGRIVILGNGGAARSIGFALANRKIPASLTFIGRDIKKVSALTEHISAKTDSIVSCAELNSPQAKNAVQNSTLLVNCTSVGMHPETDVSPISSELLHSGITVFDTIYNPSQTRLLAYAEKAGCPCSNGLSMLLFQGLASFKCWTGKDVPVDMFDLDYLQTLVG